MNLEFDNFLALNPGQKGVMRHAQMRIPIEDGLGGGAAAYDLGRRYSQLTFPRVGGGNSYVATDWGVVTTTGTNAAVARANGGILLTAGSTSTFNTNLESIDQWTTPSADKWITFMCRLKVSDITAVGFSVGIGNSQVDPATTDYTDGIYFRKAATTAPIVGRVRGNSGTAAASGTLATAVDDQDFVLGFSARLHATTPAGNWFAGTTITPFTSAQLVQLIAILTTPPVMYMNLSAKGSAGNPTVLIEAADLQIQRAD